jgi:hypothetical protein
MSIDAALRFDPAGEVPDEYDLFCEACGYSLAGLTGDRCPECGARFEPSEIPFARIPWLHRRRLGKFNAYLRTVLMVCFLPARFARELCRPVRISGKDARRFRHATMILPTALGGLAVLAMVAAAIRDYIRLAPLTPVDLLFFTLSAVAAVGAFHLFLYFATDMPLFIWKGLPAVKPAELSPVHQYACAPLAFSPLIVVVLIYLIVQREYSVTTTRSLFTALALAVAVVVPLWLWIVALALMKVSTGAPLRRVLLLAIYLPVHWLVLLALSGMVWLFFFEIERFCNDRFHVNSMFFR